jgi:hypothetical protein
MPILATYSDIKTVKTRSVCQVVFELPIEQMADAIAMLGAPVPGNEVWVGIARIDPNKVQKDEPIKLPVRNAQMAGILCGNPVFRKFLSERSGKDVPDPDAAAAVVRLACAVKSRADLDTDKHGSQLWRDLKADFEGWKIPQ